MPAKNKQTRFARWKQKNISRVNHSPARQLVRKVLPIVVGVVVLGFGLDFAQFLRQQQQLSNIVQAAPVSLPTQPVSISVPGTTITELPIEPAMISNGEWQTSDTAASHLTSSANPGENNNVVIYGHNRPHLFKSLHNIDHGDIITVTNESGTEFTYTVDTLMVVSPDDISAVLPTDYEQLTIYTCTNFLDSDRLVITANLTKVTSK